MKRDLEKIAKEVRKDIIKMLVKAGSGHSGGSLGITDVLVALYFGGLMKHDPKKPHWEERDRFILSAGHLCPTLYAVFAEVGYIPKAELNTLRRLGSRLQGHPERGEIPAIEVACASLGQGLSIGVGMALGFKLDQKKNRVFVLMSDGEQEEGSTWEAAMQASHKKLDNLTAIIDRNNLQIDGSTEDIAGLRPLDEKYRKFGWNVLSVDGHNITDILTAIGQAIDTHDAPTLIIAHTIMGKGVSFMENNYLWHGKAPSPKEGEKALEELK